MSGRGRRRKLFVRFDEESRRRFLTGFRKRKALRRKKAAQVKEKIEKEKKKQQRAQKRQRVKDALQKYDLALTEMPVEEGCAQSSSNASKTEPEHEDAKQQETARAPLKPVVQYQTHTKGVIVTVSTIPQLDSSTNWTELISRTDGELEL